MEEPLKEIPSLAVLEEHLAQRELDVMRKLRRVARKLKGPQP
ncbi:MAG: hypothetical protein QJR00_02060 [Bacillota bacterium]|nr:hypothetical protein [Bacillota bacterium]